MEDIFLGKDKFENVYNLLKDAKSVAIVGHIRPDGDCIGSCIALKLALRGLGLANADIYIDGELSSNFSYLSCYSEIITNVEFGKRYDLLVIIDSSDEARLGGFSELRNYSAKTICIDHHLNNVMQCDEVICDVTRASVGEILFEFFSCYKIEITKQIAEALYTSVSSDTGCFLFPNTTSFTHTVAAELIDKGIDLEEINYYNFRVYEMENITSLIYVLKSIKLFHNKQIAVVHIPYQKVKKGSFDEGTRHKAQKYMGDISGVKASVLFIERERGTFHVSIRSHGSVSTNEVAVHFGGGGHRNAAGCTINGKFSNVLRDVLERTIAVIDRE